MRRSRCWSRLSRVALTISRRQGHFLDLDQRHARLGEFVAVSHPLVICITSLLPGIPWMSRPSAHRTLSDRHDAGDTTIHLGTRGDRPPGSMTGASSEPFSGSQSYTASLSSFAGRNAARLDLDGLARGRVASHPCSTLPHPVPTASTLRRSLRRGGANRRYQNGTPFVAGLVNVG
jgi:hypothetical protein